MTHLTNLSASPLQADYQRDAVHHHSIGHNLPGGRFVALQIGPKGLVVTNGASEVFIPLREILDLAARHWQPIVGNPIPMPGQNTR